MGPARTGGEAGEDDGVRGADAGAGQHGEGELGDHGHVDGHVVAAADAVAAKHVGDAAHLAQDLAVGVGAGVVGLVGLPDDGRLVAQLGNVPIHAVVARVEAAAQEPGHVALGEGLRGAGGADQLQRGRGGRRQGPRTPV